MVFPRSLWDEESWSGRQDGGRTGDLSPAGWQLLPHGMVRIPAFWRPRQEDCESVVSLSSIVRPYELL